MNARLSLALAVALGLASPLYAADTAPAGTTAPMAANPFFAPSTLPYHAPPFDRIRDEHYQPAMEEGMRQQLAEMEAIANQTAAPTFENTIVAMERSGELLNRVSAAFGAVTSANTDSVL